MNIWKYFLLGFVFLGFQACDEVSRVTPNENDGDIVWVGNGLRLESSHGVLMDVKDAELGTQSVLVTMDHFLPVVRSHETNESVPVRFEWGTSQPKQGPIVQLERLDRKGECKRYESRDGELICSDLLEALSIKEGSVPLALADGSILYLDIFNSLHHFSVQKDDRIISGDVSQYFVNSTGDLFFQSSRTNQWNVVSFDGTGFIVAEIRDGDWNRFIQILKTEEDEVLGLLFDEAARFSLHRIFKQENAYVSQLIQNFEADWEWVGFGESPNIVKVRSAAKGEFWVRLTNQGFELMELPQPEKSKDLALQTQREFSVAETKDEQGTAFQLCRSEVQQQEEITDAVAAPTMTSKCTYLKRSDGYKIREVLLHYPDTLERPQLIAISERTQNAEEGSSKQRLSVFEVFTGEQQDPYLVLQSERALESEIEHLRTYDLREPQN